MPTGAVSMAASRSGLLLRSSGNEAIPAREAHTTCESVLSGRNLPFQALARGVEAIHRNDGLRRLLRGPALLPPDASQRGDEPELHQPGWSPTPATTVSLQSITDVGLTMWRLSSSSLGSSP